MKKAVSVVVALLVLILSVFYRASASERPIASGSGFNTFISEDDYLAFQSDYTFTFHVENGTLNGSGCALNLFKTHGRFSFYSNNETTLHAYTTEKENIGFGATGATFTGSNSSFIVSVPTATSVILTWYFHLPSYVDDYTVLAFGLGGIFLMIFSPTWIAWKVRKSGADVSTVERFGYGMLLFMVGLGLFITFLYW